MAKSTYEAALPPPTEVGGFRAGEVTKKDMTHGSLVRLKQFPSALAKVIAVFPRIRGMPQSMAEVEFVENNPFTAAKHRVYLSDLEPASVLDQAAWTARRGDGEACSS